MQDDQVVNLRHRVAQVVIYSGGIAYLLEMVLEDGALRLGQGRDLVTGRRRSDLVGVQVHQPHVIWESAGRHNVGFCVGYSDSLWP